MFKKIVTTFLFPLLILSHVAFAADAPASVNINQATAVEMAAVLDGVGISKAKQIVAYRKAKGAFKTVAELESVKGIGEATVKRNKSKILLK